MSTSGSSRSDDWKEIDEWVGGTGWMAEPDEDLQMASHALDGEDGLYLVDPVTFDGIEEFLAEHGEVAGVVVLLNRHKRDAAELANRFEVPAYVPEFMDDVRRDLDAPVEPIGRELPGTEYTLSTVIDNFLWKEAALYGEESGTLVVPESVGTGEFFRTSDERLGVHPGLRLNPPKKLARFRPERVLVGHGEGVFEGTADALDHALSGSRKRAPRYYAGLARDLLS
jgi:hypothetical protein